MHGGGDTGRAEDLSAREREEQEIARREEMDIFDSFGPKTRAALRDATYPWPIGQVESIRISLMCKRGSAQEDERLAASVTERDFALTRSVMSQRAM